MDIDVNAKKNAGEIVVWREKMQVKSWCGEKKLTIPHRDGFNLSLSSKLQCDAIKKSPT